MTKEEREMILNLTYLELAEKFRNEPQVLIKFLREEQKKDDKLKYIRIIDKLISLIMIIIEDYYLEDDSFNKLLIEFICFFNYLHFLLLTCSTNTQYKKILLQKYSFFVTFNWFNYIIFLKQFQENKEAIHPLLIEIGDFLLDIVKYQLI